MDKVLNRLIDLVTSTAPELWAAALEQVRAMVIQNLFWAFLLLIIAGSCAVVMRGAWIAGHLDDFHDPDAAFWAMVISGTIGFFTLVSLGFVVSKTIGLFMAPKYHAIEQLLKLVK